MARNIDADSGRPFIKVNDPVPGDVVRNLAHVAGYSTATKGTISLRIRDDDGTVIAEGTTQGGSNGVIGEFKRTWSSTAGPTSALGLWRPSRRALAGPARASTWTGSQLCSASRGECNDRKRKRT
jgi:hypothetical protein